MDDRLRSMTTVRALALFGFVVGFIMSTVSTFTHIGSEGAGPPHAWYHFFREVSLDIGALTAMTMIFFAAPRFRTPLTWRILLVTMIGYYAPFWVGIVYMPELGPPGGFGSIPDWAHIIQAFFPLLALFLGRKHFYPNSSEPVAAPADAHAAHSRIG